MKSKIYIKEIEELLKIQKINFCYFLKIGIFEELNKFSRIEFGEKKKKVLLLKYKFSETYKDLAYVKYNKETYGIDLYVYFYEKKKEKKIFLGKKLLFIIPLMTNKGTFIINGCEQALIFQILRSPGLYFSEIKSHQTKVATIIPTKGNWLIFELDSYGLIWVKTPNNLKVPLYKFLFKETLKPSSKKFIKNKFYLVYKYLKSFKNKNTNFYHKNIEFDFDSIQKKQNFDLGIKGRAQLNKILTTCHLKTNLELVDVLNVIMKLWNIKNFDNIDDLENRYITSIDEILQKHLTKGLIQFKIQLFNLFKLNNNISNWFSSFLIKSSRLSTEKIPLLKTFIEFFNSSNLCQFLDQTNDLSELIHQRKITSFGLNGLKRKNVSLNIRDIQSTFFGRLCPIETSEGQNVGLTMSLATNVIIDSKGFLKNSFYILKNNKLSSKTVWLNSREEKNYYISFENNFLNSKYEVVKKNHLLKKDKNFIKLNKKKIDYLIKSPFQIFSPSILLIPFLEHNDASRVLMGANMYKQAVPILSPENPIVSSGFELELGLISNNNIISYHRGTIINTYYDKIIVKDIYNQYITYNLEKWIMSNQRTLLNQQSIVTTGQKINYGQNLADSPSTKTSELSLGRNINVAYMSWEGYNFEDAIIISDRLIKENLFDSVQLDLITIELKKNQSFSLYKETIEKKVCLFSSQISNINIPYYLEKIEKNDILTLEIEEKNKLTNILFKNPPINKINTKLKTIENIEGYIIDIRIIKDKKNLDVFQIIWGKKMKLQVGDKMSGRHGNKGVISKIVSNNQMPYLKNGQVIDIILNPLGIPSRMNVGQIFESLWGFVGNKMHKKFKIFSFDEIYNSNASEILLTKKLVSIKDFDIDNIYSYNQIGKQVLRNGKTGKLYDNPILVGNIYMFKLIHLVEKKIHSRNIGPYQQLTQQPPRGKSSNGGQRFGEMEVWALQSHGVTYNLREFLTIKSDNSENRRFLYDSIKKKNKFPGIKIPDVFKVLIKQLNALGLSITLYGFHFKNYNTKKVDFNINQGKKIDTYKLKNKNLDFNYSTL